jgi:hypothetical protein
LLKSYLSEGKEGTAVGIFQKTRRGKVIWGMIAVLAIAGISAGGVFLFQSASAQVLPRTAPLPLGMDEKSVEPLRQPGTNSTTAEKPVSGSAPKTESAVELDRAAMQTVGYANQKPDDAADLNSFRGKTVEELLDAIAKVRAQAEVLKERQQKLVGLLKDKLKQQGERLAKLGIENAEGNDGDEGKCKKKEKKEDDEGKIEKTEEKVEKDSKVKEK